MFAEKGCVRKGGFEGIITDGSHGVEVRKAGIKNTGGSSSVGRALAFQAKGREFEPRLPLKENKLKNNKTTTI